MQAVLLLSIVILIYFVLRFFINLIIEARARLNQGEAKDDDAIDSQAMVRCAHCGIHLPQSEAYYDGQHTYCSEGHMKLGPKNHHDKTSHGDSNTHLNDEDD